MNGSNEKLRAVVLAFIMIMSVFGGTVAFSGTAAANQASLGSVQVTEDLTVRSGNAGESITLETNIDTDGSGSNQKTYNINTGDLESAGVDFSSITDSDVTSASATGTVNDLRFNSGNDRVELDYTDDGTDNVETVSITIGDDTPGTTSLTGNQLDTSGVTPGARASIEVTDQAGNFRTVSTNTIIDAADINIGSVSRTGGSLALGNNVDVSVGSLTYDSDGVSVVTSTVTGDITVTQPELGNQTVSLSGSLSGSADNLIEGNHDLSVQAGDLSDGTAATNQQARSNIDAYSVNGLRLVLDTDEGEVAGEDVVLFNSQQEVRGDILRTTTNAPRQVFADDRTVDYEVENRNGNIIANGDTNTGEFSISETYEATVTNSGFTRRDGITYDVRIGDGGSPTTGNTDTNTFSTLLDINFQIDGTAAQNADVTFDDTVQISGTVQSGNGTAIPGYRVTTKLYADSGVATPAKVGTTQTGSSGQFSFTLQLNDGVQNPNIAEITGSNGGNLGVHLGTHEVSRSDARSGDSDIVRPHPAVHYETVDTQPQAAQVSIQAQNNAPVEFEDTFSIQVLDEDGDPESNTRVIVRGAFDGARGSGSSVGPATSDDVSISTSQVGTTQIGTEDIDGDGTDDIVAFQATTDSDGFLNFTATPLQPTITVNTTAESTDAGSIDTDVPVGFSVPAGANDGDFTVFNEPDIATVSPVTFTVGSADPVNIVDEDVEDPRVANPAGPTTPGSASFRSIFRDNAAAEAPVLPLADTPTERINNNVRLGFDGNFDLSGMTVYRVQFELTDESNTQIDPNGDTTGSSLDDFDRMRITGAGINGSITASGGSLTANGNNILGAQYTNVDGDSDREYTFLIRPTNVETDNPTIDHEIDVDGESNITFSVDSDGLNIAQFQVNGNTAQAVEPDQTIDVTATVQDATQGDVPVNNGRVRLTQNGTQLDQFDARTQNIQNGEYGFRSVEISERGFDPDNDGIAEQTSNLEFTAYQYADTDNNQRLVQREVQKATVESLPIAVDDTLQVEYDAASTSEYSGVENGSFTLTRGVEYEQIAFQLTDANGNPVDLTDGRNNNQVALNDIAHDATGNDPELITLNSSDTEVSVRFDSAQSDPDNGFYVISDLESGIANVSSSTSNFNDGDSFVFGEPPTPSTAPDADTAPQSYTLEIETPSRSRATAPDTGTISAAPAEINSTVVGVAGVAVPDSVDDTDGDGDLIDELNHDQSDSSRLNTTNVSDIETPTGNINRVYRVNATVTGATGTPLDSSDFDEIQVDFDGSVDPVPPTNNVGDNALFEMVNGPGVTTNSDDGIRDFGDGSSATGISNSNDDEVQINNQDGEFQYDIEVESTGNDGTYTPVFEVEAQANIGSAPQGKSVASQSPAIQTPDVNVLDRSGAALPTNSQTGEQVLAQGVNNRLRIEAFQADADGFTLPNGLPFGFSDPKAENTAGGSTTLSQEVVSDVFDEGQKIEIDITPTGTGNDVISLTDSVNGLGNVVRNGTGVPIQFDVLSSNLQVDIGVSSTEVDPGDEISVTLRQEATGQTLPENTQVSLINTDGNEVNAAQTNANGVAVLTVPTDASTGGTFTIQTRPAGFEPNSIPISVSEPIGPPTATVTFDDQDVQNGSTSVDVASATFNGSEDFVIVVHRASPGDNGVVDGPDEIGAKIGSSDVLTDNTVSNVPVDLTKSLDEDGNTQLTEDQTLIAMLHVANESRPGDTNFGDPITRGGSPVFDQADITVTPESPLEGPAGEFDTNGDGDISVNELGDAGSAFTGGELSLDELTEVATEFTS